MTLDKELAINPMNKLQYTQEGVKDFLGNGEKYERKYVNIYQSFYRAYFVFLSPGTRCSFLKASDSRKTVWGFLFSFPGSYQARLAFKSVGYAKDIIQGPRTHIGCPQVMSKDTLDRWSDYPPQAVLRNPDDIPELNTWVQVNSSGPVPQLTGGCVKGGVCQ